MKRILAIGDIHGSYNELIKLLDIVKFNPKEDQIIFTGDYVDRGLHSKEVIEKVIDLVKNHNAIAIGGNHDDMFLDWIEDEIGETDEYYPYQGGDNTIRSYTEDYGFFNNGPKAKQIIKDYFPEHIEFLKNLPDYYELDDFIFVHAGINPILANWKNSTRSDFRWIRQHFIANKNETGKKIIFGHTITRLLHNNQQCNDIWVSSCGTKIGIDGGCVFDGQLNCLEIKDGKFTQYSVLKIKEEK